MTEPNKLPPLPYPQIPGNDYTASDMQEYARAAIEADRKRRGEPVAWTVKGVSRPRTWTWWVGVHEDAESTAKLNAQALGDVSLAVPLYLAPQPQQIPEPCTDYRHHERYVAGWNACRATMLEVAPEVKP